MSERFSLTIIDRIEDRVHALIADYQEAKGSYAQDGTAKESYEDAELAMGIRVHAGESMIAPGYFGRVLGSIDVTDPHYNALVVHEIVGHPVEADRALKMETGYADRTWLYRGPQDNMLGQRIASELVTAYSDTSLQGFGMYTYDAEGVRAKWVVRIDTGILTGFLNRHEAAAVLGEEPNGALRAYLMSIDAVGYDFKLIPVPNCGKGQPMQSMRVGNGGPTMRGRAKILGGDAMGEGE